MSDILESDLKKAIRVVVSNNAGEPVGLKSLLASLEKQFGLPKGGLASRKNEVRDILVAVMEEEDESSSEEEIIPTRPSAGTRARAQQGPPNPQVQQAREGPLSRNSGAASGVDDSQTMVEDDDVSDKTAGKSRAGQIADHQGFLKKRGDQGRLKLWRKRHFRLYRKEGVIAYFKGEKDAEQLGEVSVVGAFLIDKRDDLGKNSFTITMKTTARVWVLQAPDEATMNQWIQLCTPLMKESAAVRAVGDKKPPKPANGLPLQFPPTYVQGFAERDATVTLLQSGDLDWTKLSHVPAVVPVPLEAGQVSLSFHGSSLAVVEEVRELHFDANHEVHVEDLPKQLKYSAETVVWSAVDSQLLQTRFTVDEKTQRDLLKKLVGRKITASVPGSGLGHGEDAGKREETRLNPPESGHHHHAGGGLAFPNDAVFTGKLYYDQQDDRYALVEEQSNTVHFLDTRAARTIAVADANVQKLNVGTTATFAPPRLWARFQTAAPKSLGLLTYRLKEGFDFHINYVLLLSADEKFADVEGWYSVQNKTSKTYNNASVRFIPDPKEEARKLKEKEETVEDVAKDVAKEEVGKKLGGGLMALAAAFGKKEEVVEPPPPKLHHYPLVQRVTLPSYDWAHAAFVSQKVAVRTQHLITFDTPKYTIKPIVDKEAGAVSDANVSTVVRFTNPLKESALPSGTAQVNRLDRSGLGATQVADVTLGRVEGNEIVTLQLEKLFGVSATRVQTGFNFDAEKHFIIETIEITISNGRNETVVVTVEDSLYRWANWELSASKPAHTPTAHPRRISWDLRLNHGEYVTLKYTSFYQNFELASDYDTTK